MMELNEDQRKIVDTLKKPSAYFGNSDNGFQGLPYKEIMKITNLSKEKTLLSLGWLEQMDIVNHTCAIQRNMVDYLGHSSIEITGQKIVRMFFLTPKGKQT